MVNALHNFGIQTTLDQTKELMNKLDTNNNGYIDYTEFLAGCMRSKIYLKEDYLKSAFQYFDKVRIMGINPCIGLEWKNIYIRTEVGAE